MICLLLNGTSGHANAINQLCECNQSIVVTVNNRVGNFLGHEKRSPVNLIIVMASHVCSGQICRRFWRESWIDANAKGCTSCSNDRLISCDAWA